MNTSVQWGCCDASSRMQAALEARGAMSIPVRDIEPSVRVLDWNSAVWARIRGWAQTIESFGSTIRGSHRLVLCSMTRNASHMVFCPSPRAQIPPPLSDSKVACFDKMTWIARSQTGAKGSIWDIDFGAWVLMIARKYPDGHFEGIPLAS